jgi:hypothetical protein
VHLLTRYTLILTHVDSKMRFDSGGLRMAHNSEVVPTQSEEDVFMVLGIPWLCEFYGNETERNGD